MIPFDSDMRTDLEGKPLKGRIFFFQKDTNQLDTIYTFDNSELVECENPVYTDSEGYLEHDVILENRVYSIKQQVYKGDYDSPKADTRESMWKDDRCYYAGLDLDENGSTEPIVFGISGLKDSAIALEKVNVIGYHNNFDCGMRTYVWDETALDLADNGQVVKSNHSATGRWLLVNTLPYIPGEYYGVYAGHEENISTLFGASLTYGTNNKMISPLSIKLKRGTYSIGSNLITSRTLLLEDKVDFGSTYRITCKDVLVIGNKSTNPIGRFKFNGDNVEVHSYIFYDLFEMLTSGAKTIHVYDVQNNQTVEKNADITCKDMTFIQHGSITYSQTNFMITFDNCHFIGGKIFPLRGKYILKNMPATDLPFGSVGEYETATCPLDIENFSEGDMFAHVATRTYHMTDVDLQGKTFCKSMNIGTIIIDPNVTYRNASIGYVAPHGVNTTFVNCTIRKVSVDVGTGTQFVSCVIDELEYNQFDHDDTDITLIDSRVNSLRLNEYIKCSITAKRTKFNSSIGHDIEQASYYDPSSPFIGSLDFDECEVDDDIVIRGQSSFKNCLLHGSIWTQDYLEGNNYVIRSSFISCVIDGRHVMQHNVAYRENVRSYCIWKNNTFNNTEKNPIYPESWSDPLGEGTFTRNDCTKHYLDPYPSHHSWTYKGNKGPKVIPDYPIGSYTSLMNIAGSSGFAKITEVPFVAPGHSIKSVNGDTYEQMDSEDMYMNNLKMWIRLYREVYWTGNHQTRHMPDLIDNPEVIFQMVTNKAYNFDGGYSWTCRPRKTTAFWENSSEAYFRMMFDIDSPNHDWGNREDYGSLDMIPYYSVKYT